LFVSLGEPSGDGAGVIPAAIVDEQYFKAVIGQTVHHSRDTVEQLRQIVLLVVGRDHDRD